MSAHFYNYKGELVAPWEKDALPSPSTILDRLRSPEREALVRRVGQEEADRIMGHAAERGSRIHEATYQLDIGNQRWRAYMEDEDKPYVEGYLRWLEEYKPEIVEAEVFVISDRYKYAGRLDRVYRFPDGSMWIVDLKTGMDSVRHGLQLKFYQQAYFEMTGAKARMGVLALDPSLKCGYRNSRRPLGLQEYREPLWGLEAHIRMFTWWHKKQPPKAPADASKIWVQQ